MQVLHTTTFGGIGNDNKIWSGKGFLQTNVEGKDYRENSWGHGWNGFWDAALSHNTNNYSCLVTTKIKESWRNVLYFWYWLLSSPRMAVSVYSLYLYLFIPTFLPFSFFLHFIHFLSTSSVPSRASKKLESGQLLRPQLLYKSYSFPFYHHFRFHISKRSF